MNIRLLDQTVEAQKDAPVNIQRAFEKQLRFLARDLKHPSLHAKKYNESTDLWQAYVNQNWRFYFLIQGDTYVIIKLIPHPK
jgi:plasmid maintenance system killer protein